jgi:hypothetical protein
MGKLTNHLNCTKSRVEKQGRFSPSGLVNSKINVKPEELTEEFRYYKQRISRQVVVLQHKEDRSRLLVLRPWRKSRYFEVGRWSIKRRLKRRLQGLWQVTGVMLTLTYDPKRISRVEAWSRYGADVRRFLNALNAFRRKKGFRRLSYLWVVELQPGTGYPHIHVFFPKLKWLASKGYLQSLWDLGWSRVEKARTINGVSYICKYVTKLKGWDEESQALLWAFRGRLYSLSQKFYVPRAPGSPKWQLWCVLYGVESLSLLVAGLEGGGFRVELPFPFTSVVTSTVYCAPALKSN